MAPVTGENVVRFPRAKQAPLASSREDGWKASRYRPGARIKRISGYKIVEDVYGVSYLYRTGSRPERTQVDRAKYPFSGYQNWQSLATAGLLKEEIDGRNGAERAYARVR